jgi:hypothetical protein
MLTAITLYPVFAALSASALPLHVAAGVYACLVVLVFTIIDWPCANMNSVRVLRMRPFADRPVIHRLLRHSQHAVVVVHCALAARSAHTLCVAMCARSKTSELATIVLLKQMCVQHDDDQYAFYRQHVHELFNGPPAAPTNPPWYVRLRDLIHKPNHGFRYSVTITIAINTSIIISYYVSVCVCGGDGHYVYRLLFSVLSATINYVSQYSRTVVL